MSNFDVKFDNKEAYTLFMLENTMGLEGKALSSSPVFGSKSTAEAKRAELADKVNSFLRQHADFIETDVDQERARALTARANVVANPVVHPALVAKGAAAAAVVVTLALGADQYFKNGASRQAIVGAVETASNAVMSIPTVIGGFVSEKYTALASYMPNMLWTKGNCAEFVSNKAIEDGREIITQQTVSGVKSLFACFMAGGNFTN